MKGTLYLPSVLLAFSVVFGQQSEIRHWDLELTAVDADVSPDDHLLAVTRESGSTPQPAGSEIAVSLELWDYGLGKVLATAQLTSYRSTTVRPIVRPRPVRFTSDGSLLAVSDGNTVRVFAMSPLRPIRSIQPAVDPLWQINSIETSPVDHSAIIISGGRVFAYELDSGNLLFEWNPPRDTAHSIAWKPAGTQFAIAASRPCTPAGTVDILGTSPWSRVQTLKAKNVVSLTFSRDRLYMVQSGTCKGLFANRHLGIQVFDTQTWRALSPILLEHKDAHGFVSFADGRLLADTGEVKTEHDWLDATTWGVPTSVQLTMWGRGLQPIFTSEPFAISPRSTPPKLRFSRSGRIALLLRPQHLEILEVP